MTVTQKTTRSIKSLSRAARAANTASERSNVAQHGVNETWQRLAGGIEIPCQAIDQRRGDNYRIGDAGDIGGLAVIGGVAGGSSHTATANPR